MSKILKKLIKFILIAIGILIVGIIGIIIILFIWESIAFHDLGIREADVREQIAIEGSALDAYKPILDYVEEYKAKTGNYPKELPQKYKDIVSDKFDGFNYEVTKYGGYTLKVFPKHGPIEFYQPKNLYHWRTKDDGIEDGPFDNEYYYKVGNDWQAIHFQYYTRYNDKFLDVDSCLDGGGCWDYVRHRCETKDQGYCCRNEQECIERNGKWQENKKYCKLK